MYEKEADQVADQVVQRLAEPDTATPAVDNKTQDNSEIGKGLQRSPLSPITSPISIIQRQEAPELEMEAEEGPEEELQRKPIFESPGIGDEPIQRKCAACEAEDEGMVQRMPFADTGFLSGLIQPKCAACEAKEDVQPKRLSALQRSGDGSLQASDDFSSRLQSSKGGGHSLPQDTQANMGGAIGADFSNVRVHTGSEAAGLSQEIGAQAFTHGSDIYFNEGKYDPGSSSGQHLLAHELTHTVQQGGSTTVRRAPSRGAGGCGPLRALDEDNSGTYGAGRTAHEQIQDFVLNSGILAELTIPRGTKSGSNLGATACRPPGVHNGRADLWKFSGTSRIALGEIKPFGFAARYGVPDLNHYKLRSRQSMDRLTGSGLGSGRCGSQAADSHDQNFGTEIGFSGSRKQFTSLTGILSNTTIIGPFRDDRARTLKAKQATPGVIGYWCTGGGSDTYTCGISDKETDQYINQVVSQVTDYVDKYVEEKIHKALDEALDNLSFEKLFRVGGQMAGSSLIGVVKSMDIPSILLKTDNLAALGAYLDSQIGARGRAVMQGYARKIKNVIITELKRLIRRTIRQFIRQILVSICVGAPAVSLAKLLDELAKRIDAYIKSVMPALIYAVSAVIMADIAALLEQMIKAFLDALSDLWDVVKRPLAIIAAVVLCIVVIVLAIIEIIAILDPIPGDEVAIGAALMALLRLIPTLFRFGFAFA